MIALRLIGYGLLLLGPLLSLLLFREGVRYWRAARAVRKWSSVSATILATNMRSLVDERADKTYSPVARFRFVVQGQTYESDTLSMMDLMGGYRGTNLAAAEKLRATYPPGKQVTAIYDPKDPSRAVLRTDVPAIAVPFLFGMGLFILIGMLIGGGVMVYLF